jgi:dolichol-phosphate mannosyltransferase
MDADFSHDPKDVPKLIRVARDYDIVNGSRHMKGGRIETTWFRNLSTILLKIYMSVLLRLRITDYTNGFFSIKRSLLKKTRS